MPIPFPHLWQRIVVRCGLAPAPTASRGDLYRVTLACPKTGAAVVRQLVRVGHGEGHGHALDAALGLTALGSLVTYIAPTQAMVALYAGVAPVARLHATVDAVPLPALSDALAVDAAGTLVGEVQA